MIFMDPLFKKLNFKNHEEIFVINPPDSLAQNLEEMKGVTKIFSRLAKAKTVDFIVAFVTRQKEVDELAKSVVPLLGSDAVVWFAYPKGTSKRYKCEFNRDNGWKELGKAGFEGVRMVAVDEDWSALRFRRASHIKTMTRSFAMSEEGKKKVAASLKKR